jgi:WXG100 family type VII secretion target
MPGSSYHLSIRHIYFRESTMPQEIKASPAALESAAENIAQQADIISRELSGLSDQLQALRRTFVGKRAEGFYRQYHIAQEDMLALTQTVRQISDQLRQSASRLRAADNA